LNKIIPDGIVLRTGFCPLKLRGRPVAYLRWFDIADIINVYTKNEQQQQQETREDAQPLEYFDDDFQSAAKIIVSDGNKG
jgi:hypothetical protein